MTADTLSAEEREAALSHLRHVLRFGGLVRTNEPGRDFLLALLERATPELLALGEAAVRYETLGAELPTRRMAALAESARAYAASVASIPTKTGVE